jgi:hypothetical protein
MVILACTHTSGVERRKQEDGSYRVDCKQPLSRCLTAIEEICGDGYEILRAQEARRLVGPREINEPIVSSEVVARCGPPNRLFGDGEKREVPATPGTSSPSGGAAPPSPGRTCFPGATQACTGPAACHGGQQCLADGLAFGPCDCGGAAPAAPAVSPATPDGGAAPPR